MAIVITFGIGAVARPDIRFYITPDYVFCDNLTSQVALAYSWFSDFKEMKHYLVMGEDRQVLSLDHKTPGARGGWSIVGKKLISREVGKNTTFLGLDCVQTEEVHEMPDNFSPTGPGRRTVSYFCACKIPELEALPLQTKLHPPFYKEWKLKEYPFELRQWMEEGSTIVETFSTGRAPFPVERIREIFGVDLK